MISVPLSRLRQVQTVARRALGITPRGPSPPVVLETTQQQLTVRCGHARGVAEHVAEYVTKDGFQPARLVLPFESLSAFGGRGDVTLESAEGGRVTARWTDRRVPQVKTFAAEDDSLILPVQVPKFSENPPSLLAALHEAMLTTDRESVRYALGAVQLRGGQGVLAATDSRQALLQSGFDFGWGGEVLLPRTGVFASKELPQDQPVLIGVDAERKWLCLRVGPWTLQLPLLVEGRFPRVDDIVSAPAGAEARLLLGESDAAFLAETLPKLPGGGQFNSPVTLDLNVDGPAVVRARGEDDPRPTEVVLAGSRRTGKPMRLCMNRLFLHRAVSMGFRELLVFDAESPVQARDKGRVYLWALLTPEDALPPTREAQRLAAPPSPASARPRSSPPRNPSPPRTPATAPPAERRQRPMSRSSPEPNPNGHHRSNDGGPPVTAAELIERAEEVRSSLRHAVAVTGELIAGLKRHKKRSSLVRSTLQSLKQLQGLEP